MKLIGTLHGRRSDKGVLIVRALLLMFLLVAANSVIGQSQGPAPGPSKGGQQPQEKATKSQQATAASHRSTKNAPPVVESKHRVRPCLLPHSPA